MSDDIKHNTPNAGESFNQHYHPTIGDLLRQVQDHKEATERLKALDEERTRQVFETRSQLELEKHVLVEDAAIEMFESQTGTPELVIDGATIELNSPEDCVPHVIEKVEAQIDAEIQATSQHYTGQQLDIVDHTVEQRMLMKQDVNSVKAEYAEQLSAHYQSFEDNKFNYVTAAIAEGIEKPESHVYAAYQEERQSITSEMSSAIESIHDSYGFDASDHSMSNSISI